MKVLDFGLAKLAVGSSEGGPHERGSATQPLAALSMSPTIAMPGGTAVGVILGTAAYHVPRASEGAARRQAQRHVGVRPPIVLIENWTEELKRLVKPADR